MRSDASDAADNVEAVNGAIAISAAVAKAIGFITVRHVIRVHAGRLEPNITYSARMLVCSQTDVAAVRPGTQC